MAHYGDRAGKAGFALAFAAKFASSTVYSLINASLVAYAVMSFAVGSAEAGFAVGAFTLASIAGRVPAGRLADVRGPERVLAHSSVAFLVGTVLCGAAPSMPGLLVARAIQGAAFGAFHNTITVTVSMLLPREHLGRGMGVFAVSTALSSALGPFLGIALQQGFPPHAVFDAASALALLSCACAWALFACSRRRGATFQGPAAQNEPIAPSSSAPCRSRNAPLRRSAPARADAHGRCRIGFFAEGALPYALASMVACACYAAVTSFVAPCLVDRGLGAFAPFYFAPYPFILVPLRPYLGHLVDRGHAPRVALFCLAAMSAGLFTLALAWSAPMLFCSSALLIAGYGGSFFVLQAAAVKKCKGRGVGATASTFGVLSDIGLAAGPMLTGALDAAIGYEGAFFAGAALMAATALAWLFASRSRRRALGSKLSLTGGTQHRRA